VPALQTCDQTARGLPYNTLGLFEDLDGVGGVQILVRWTWDHVSVWPVCDGPLANGSGAAGKWAVQAVNTGTVPAYLHTTKKDGSPITYTLVPGQTANITVAQAANNGYAVLSDFGNLTLTATP
jgi:hypothetical protein